MSQAQIEAYMKAHGLLKGDNDLASQQDFSQLSKSIMTNSKCAIDVPYAAKVACFDTASFF